LQGLKRLILTERFSEPLQADAKPVAYQELTNAITLNKLGHVTRLELRFNSIGGYESPLAKEFSSIVRSLPSLRELHAGLSVLCHLKGDPVATVRSITVTAERWQHADVKPSMRHFSTWTSLRSLTSEYRHHMRNSHKVDVTQLTQLASLDFSLVQLPDCESIVEYLRVISNVATSLPSLQSVTFTLRLREGESFKEVVNAISEMTDDRLRRLFVNALLHYPATILTDGIEDWARRPLLGYAIRDIECDIATTLVKLVEIDQFDPATIIRREHAITTGKVLYDASPIGYACIMGWFDGMYDTLFARLKAHKKALIKRLRDEIPVGDIDPLPLHYAAMKGLLKDYNFFTEFGLDPKQICEPTNTFKAVNKNAPMNALQYALRGLRQHENRKHGELIYNSNTILRSYFDQVVSYSGLEHE
jgi:hypothetical protein